VEKRTSSILTELRSYVPDSRKSDALEARGQHVISSVLNFLDLIDQSYDAETATLLKNRFLNSIKTGEPDKFTKSIKRIKRDSEI
jgi:hypothetical protein